MNQTEIPCSARLLDVLATKVHQHLGLDFSGARRADLLKRLGQLAQEQEEEPRAWLESLAFGDWNDQQIQMLTPAFTVGETYFRRDAEALDWLARQHLAPLLQRRRAAGHRYLRIWSAACCTGEEAYSLLFLLDDLLGDERSQWTIDVLASDINAGFLARAEQGRYGQNAFRRSEELFRSRYFETRGRSWQVRPEWHGRIRFLRHNLANGELPDPKRGLASADLILCRHVLMYFSQGQAAAALHRLMACLGEDGILVLSAVEAALATHAGLQGFWAGTNYALRPGGQISGAVFRHAEPSPSAVVLPTAGGFRRSEEPATFSRHIETQQQPAPSPSRPDSSASNRYDDCLQMARRCADRQHDKDAHHWLQRARELDPSNPMSYWLQAQLAIQNGDALAALQSLHKALYLEPNLAMAHFQQGLLLREVGRHAAGDKALRVCLKLLGGTTATDMVPFGEGLSHGRLSRLCEQLLEDRP